MANLLTTIGNDVVSTYAAGENENPCAWEVEKALQITFNVAAAYFIKCELDIIPCGIVQCAFHASKEAHQNFQNLPNLFPLIADRFIIIKYQTCSCFAVV